MYKLFVTILATCLCLNMASFANLNDKDMRIKKFESEEELKELINTHYAGMDDYYVFAESDMSIKADSIQNSTNLSPSASMDSSVMEYSDTNVQVQGVDEADIVKTNGNYIYYLTNNNLVIAKASPAEDLKIVKTIDLAKDGSIYGQELYINDEYIAVILNGYKSSNDSDNFIMGRYNSEQLSIIKVFDINTYKLLKEVEVSGGYVSSRRIDDYIYDI